MQTNMKNISLNHVLKKHSSTLLSAYCIGGVIATTAMAIHATLKVNNLPKKHDKKEVAVLYGPTIAMAGSTILGIVSLNSMCRNTQASLCAAYTTLANSYSKYRNAAKKIEIEGETIDSVIERDIVKQPSKYDDISKKKYSGYEPILIYDNFSERFFECPLIQLTDAEYQFNKRFQTDGEVSVNDFYRDLGIPCIYYGDDLGWNVMEMSDYYNYCWIDFELMPITSEDNDPDFRDFYTLSTLIPPKPDFREY